MGGIAFLELLYFVLIYEINMKKYDEIMHIMQIITFNVLNCEFKCINGLTLPPLTFVWKD